MRLWERITFRTEREVYYYDTDDKFEFEDFAIRLYQMIREESEKRNKHGVMLLCIGTDRSTVDSLGPLIG